MAVDLAQLCSELHRRLAADESWEEVRKFVFTHDDLFQAARCTAQFARYADKSLDVETTAWALLSHGFTDCPNPPKPEKCVGGLWTMLRRWLLKLPHSQLIIHHKKLRQHFHRKPTALDSVANASYEVLQEYEPEFQFAMLLSWIREFEEPLRTIAFLRYEQNKRPLEISKIVQRAPSTVTGYLNTIRERLVDRIKIWREEE